MERLGRCVVMSFSTHWNSQLRAAVDTTKATPGYICNMHVCCICIHVTANCNWRLAWNYLLLIICTSKSPVSPVTT